MRRTRTILMGIIWALLWNAGGAQAGLVEVVKVRASDQGGGKYGFSVTLRHADTGWKHYADKWDVLAPDGTVLGTRVLIHPHVDEQPFTRSLSGVAAPGGVRDVTIRAHDKVHGYSDKVKKVRLPGR